jgi:hypothetical protein
MTTWFSLVPSLARRWVTAVRRPPLLEMGIGWARERTAIGPCRECEAVWVDTNAH